MCRALVRTKKVLSPFDASRTINVQFRYCKISARIDELKVRSENVSLREIESRKLTVFVLMQVYFITPAFYDTVLNELTVGGCAHIQKIRLLT